MIRGGLVGIGVKSFQNSVLVSSCSVFVVKRFYKTNIDRMVDDLTCSEKDQVEMLKGCVNAWELSGMADSLYSDLYKELVCIRYFKGYKRGGLELNTKNSALYEFKGSFSYKIYLNLPISEKASLDVTICNRFSLGASIGAKHRKKS